MRFNYSALRGRIVERYGTTAAFAKEINMSRFYVVLLPANFIVELL